MTTVTIEGTLRLENILDEISEYRDFVRRMVIETVERRMEYLEKAYRQKRFLFIKIYSEDDVKRLAQKNANVINEVYSPFKTVESLVRYHYNWRKILRLEEVIDFALEMNGKVTISDNDINILRFCYIRKTPWEVDDLLETIP